MSASSLPSAAPPSASSASPSASSRDEAFTSEDNSRLAPLYSKTSSPADKNVKLQFTTLKTYMDNYRTKLGKVKAEEITAASLQTQPAPATNKQQQKQSQQQAASGKQGTAGGAQN